MILAVPSAVTVPASTPAGRTVYVAGDLQGWSPGATPMAQSGDGTWSITLPLPEGSQIQYKYTLGTWSNVEKDSACAEIDNRTATIACGSSGAMTLDDVVPSWRNVSTCGD